MTSNDLEQCFKRNKKLKTCYDRRDFSSFYYSFVSDVQYISAVCCRSAETTWF